MYLLTQKKMVNKIQEIVLSVIQDVDNMEEGMNSFSYEDESIAIDIDCKLIVEIERIISSSYDVQPHPVGKGEVIPKSILLYVRDDNGEWSEAKDITNEFKAYNFKS